MTLAALGIEASTSGVDTSTEELKALAGAAADAEKATDKLAPATKKAGAGAEDMGGKAGKAAAETNKLGREVRTTDGALAGLATRAASVIGALAGMAATALSVGAYIRMADSWSDMRSQIGAAIGDMSAAGEMMQRLTDIANASYSPLDQTVQVYARNVGALRDLGKGAEDAAKYTESLNHMLVITATKGERAASVQEALAKAMAVGKLQADGLETVLANGGRVAEALASELGTTVSGLRALASEGKITGQVIADALIGQLDQVRVTAADMPATVGDALVRIGTNLTQLVGNFDQATGASAALSGAIINLADWIGNIASTDFASWGKKAADAITTLGQAVLVLASTRLPALAASMLAVNLSGAVTTAMFVAGAIASRAMTVAMGLQATAARGLGAAMAFVGGPIGLVVAGAAALGLAAYNTNSAYNEWGIATNNVATAQGRLNDALDNFSRDKSISAVEATREQAQATVDAITAQIDAASNAKWFWQSTDDIAAMKGELIGALAILDMTNQAWDTINTKTADEKNGVIALTEEQIRAADAANQMALSYQNRATLAAAELQYGKDSAQYLAAQLSQERALQFSKIASLDISARQKEQLRAQYNQMVINEAKTRGWVVEIGKVSKPLSEAYDWLVKISATQPGSGWLDTAIAKAAGLATQLWDAVAANNALSVSSASAGSDERGSQRRIVHDATGYTRDNPLKSSAGSGGGGGGGGGGADTSGAMQSLVTELSTERETLTVWYAEKLALIQSASDSELQVLGGRAMAIESLEAEHQAKLRDLRDQERSYEISAQSSMYTTLAGLLTSFGSQSRAAQIAALAINTGMRIRETLQNAASASVRALAELGPIAGPPAAAKIMTYGKIQAGLIAAQGIGSAVGAGGGGASASSAGSAASNSTASSTAPETPLRVSIDAIDPNASYTGGAIQKMFEAIQKEAGNRGIIWVADGVSA